MVSVIIPTYMEEKCIAETIESLLKLDIEEIIIVDDKSTDKTQEIVKQYPVTLLTKKGVQGKAQSILEGAQYTSSQDVIVIDADCKVESITDIVEKLEAGADLVGGIVAIEKDGSLAAEIEAQEYKTSIETIKPKLYKLGYLVSLSGAILGIKTQHIIDYPVPDSVHGEDMYWTQIGQQLGWKIELSTSKVETKKIPGLKALLTQRARWVQGWASCIRATGRKTPLLEIVPTSYRIIATILAALGGDMVFGSYWIGIAIALLAYFGWEYSQSKSLKIAACSIAWKQITFVSFFYAMVVGKQWSVQR